MEKKGKYVKAWEEVMPEANGSLWCLGALLEPAPLLSLNNGTGVSSATYLDDLRSLGIVFSSKAEAEEASRWISEILKEEHCRSWDETTLPGGYERLGRLR